MCSNIQKDERALCPCLKCIYRFVCVCVGMGEEVISLSNSLLIGIELRRWSRRAMEGVTIFYFLLLVDLTFSIPETLDGRFFLCLQHVHLRFFPGNIWGSFIHLSLKISQLPHHTICFLSDARWNGCNTNTWYTKVETLLTLDPSSL